jgi:hypothetical protein
LSWYSSLEALDKQVSKLSKSPSASKKEVAAAKSKALDLYVKVMLGDITFAVAKDLPNKMWRKTFYARIAQLRKEHDQVRAA